MTNEELYQLQAKACMDYKRRKMEKFKPINAVLNRNFDNDAFECMFLYTEAESDTIHVDGHSTDVFVINAAIGLLLNQIHISQLNATLVFKELFRQCNADEIKAILNSIYGKQS